MFFLKHHFHVRWDQPRGVLTLRRIPAFCLCAACNKSDCNPNLKDSRAALQARDLEQLDTLEGRPILVKRALPARLAQAFYAA